MSNINIGDIVARKSYGGDVYFKVAGITTNERGKTIYILKGLLYRLMADSDADDLVLQDPVSISNHMQQEITAVRKHATRGGSSPFRTLLYRLRTRPGRILHIDASQDFLAKCIDYYRGAGVTGVARHVSESMQPQAVGSLLKSYNPDILVLTGHDGIKKGSSNLHSVDSYRNSKYFIQAVKEARKYQPDPDKLCIFAGACQSYFEAIMEAGANFASSPGRILINALDPAIVSRKVALTDRKKYVTPEEVATLTVSGSKGIGGVRSKGQMTVY